MERRAADEDEKCSVAEPATQPSDAYCESSISAICASGGEAGDRLGLLTIVCSQRNCGTISINSGKRMYLGL
jgi:hypothetical protein